ncbi:hypothetical protein BN1723_018803, partial [Verticillium longisporum]
QVEVPRCRGSAW